MRFLLVIALIMPMPASAFMAKNGMIARQVGPTEIAVEFHTRRSDTDYWCAAGDFARRALGLPGDTRLWRATPKPRQAGGGIVFTLDEARKADGAGISSFGSGPRDGSISVGMAVGNFCRPLLFYWDD